MMRFFDNDADALDLSRRLNQQRKVNSRSTIYVVVDGPEDNHVVVKLQEAIDMGLTYRWAA